MAKYSKYLKSKYAKCLLIFLFVVIIILYFFLKDRGTIKKTSFQVSYSELDLVYGVESAPVVVVVYSNYECAFCRKFYLEVFPKLKEEYIDDGLVRLVIKPTLFTNTQNLNFRATKMLSCLAKYGNFEKMHELLVAQPSAIYNKDFNNVLDEFIEKDEFIAECMVGGESNSYIMENYAHFQALGFTGTPSFVINDYAIKGYVKYKKIKEIIESKL